MSWEDFYKDVKLDPEEERLALLEGKIKKYNREKHKDHWNEEEPKIAAKKEASTDTEKNFS